VIALRRGAVSLRRGDIASATCAGVSGSNGPDAARHEDDDVRRRLPDAFSSDTKVIVPKRGRMTAFLLAPRLRSSEQPLPDSGSSGSVPARR
jgi:hypothetical protein